MSTQLIVYPQTYNGTHNSTFTPTTTQFVVDGVVFTGINASFIYQSSTTIANLLYSLSTLPVAGTWYRWRHTANTPAYPLETGGNLVLNSLAPSSSTGVFQRLSNLIPGAVYTLTVNMTPGVVGLLYLEVSNLNTNSSIATANLTSAIPQATLSFTAQTPNDTISIVFFNVAAANLTISSISVVWQSGALSGVYTDLNDGQVICDLYEEEDIPLTLSIDDFKNVAEQVKSYSKDFNLPATKRNYRIFNNMFEVTRADDGLIFNPYVKTKCVLKQDGFILFEGYLRMINVKDDEGEISYNVNLYSEVIALADTLKEATFADLDFTELAHDYNKQQIKYSWEGAYGSGVTYLNPSTSGFRTSSTVKYPFIDWTHQYIIAPTGSSATAGNPQLTTLEQSFRPCIQLKYLINRIFEPTVFTWTSTFFDSADFEKLYMDFNWGSDNAPVVFNSSGELTKIDDFPIPLAYTTLNFDEMTAISSPNTGNPLSADFGYSAGVFTAQEDGQVYTINYSLGLMYLTSTYDELDIEWLVNGVSFDAYSTNFQYDIYSGTITTSPLQAGDTILCRARSYYNEYEFLGIGIYANNSLIQVTTSVNQMTNETILQTLRGELGQWDFLKGIMTMFNLVSLVNPDEVNDILIEPYSDVFINNTAGTTLAARSIQHDWTTKVDVSQMELKPLTDLNKTTVFKFVEDDDDYVFNVYKQSTSGHLYGSLIHDASGFTILKGKEEIIAEPFAATVSKPIDSQFSSFIVPSVYAKNGDDTTEGFDNSPRIFYNNGVKSTGASYYIPAQNGLFSENQTNFLQFSHMSAIPATASSRDFVFASEQLFSPLGPPPTNNLYNTYWAPYFNELYNPDTRMMTLKVNLTPADINTFKFYDMVFIKNRVFRVNKIEYKPNELAKVEFILLP